MPATIRPLDWMTLEDDPSELSPLDMHFGFLCDSCDDIHDACMVRIRWN